MAYACAGFLVFFIFSCKKNSIAIETMESNRIDSVSHWIRKSKDNKLKRTEHLTFLKKAFNGSLEFETDSVKIENLLKISDRAYSIEEDSLFGITNKNIYEIATKSNDSSALAEYHWNIGNFFTDKVVLDSAYYHYGKARQLYFMIGHEYYGFKMEYNLSFLEFRVKNYLQSEISIISAINGFEKLDRKLNLFNSYNRLLLIDKALGNYSSALNHYSIASTYLIQLDEMGVYREKLLNNLSLIYQKQKEFDLAITTLNKALENSELQNRHPNLYAKLIDNRAFCMFLNEEGDHLLDTFMEALLIRQKLGNEAGVAMSKIHMSQYFLKNKDSLRAFQDAKTAFEISSRLGMNGDILVSLELLSKTDPAHATAYMNQYTVLNDSLIQQERKIRDKFTRIQFETENYIAANKDLKKKNVWISLTSGLALFSLGLFFFLYRQKAMNRTLLLEQQQLSFNEEIYNLMLKKQNRTEEGRIQERVRISQELHDGILARLFSVRIGLGFLNVLESNKEKEQYDSFMKELQRVEKEIRTLSHELKNDDLSAKKDFTILISELLEEQSKLGKFRYKLKKDHSIAWHRVDEVIKINLYRMVQEAICNIIKYAGAQEVIVSLLKEHDFIELLIVDDGVGFDTNKKNKGIGLKNMASRAKSIAAKIQIESEIYNGTLIRVTIPTKTLYHEAKK